MQGSCFIAFTQNDHNCFLTKTLFIKFFARLHTCHKTFKQHTNVKSLPGHWESVFMPCWPQGRPEHFVIVWNNVWFRHLFQSWSGLTFPSTFLSIPQPHSGNVYDHHPHDQMSLLDTTKAGCLDIICRRLPGRDQIRHAEKTLFQVCCKRATESKDRNDPSHTDTTLTAHFRR